MAATMAVRRRDLAALRRRHEALAARREELLLGSGRERAHLNVSGAKAMAAKQQGIREVQREMATVRSELLRTAAGPNPFVLAHGVGAAEPAARANGRPLRVTVMTEADLAQADNVQRSQLRDSLTVLLHSTAATSAVAAALSGVAAATAASAVELHGSTVAVLDAAGRCRAGNTSYTIGFSPTEVPDPRADEDAAADQSGGGGGGQSERVDDPSPTHTLQMPPEDWAKQHFGLGVVQAKDSAAGAGAGAFDGLPGTESLARRFDNATDATATGEEKAHEEEEGGGVSDADDKDDDDAAVRDLETQAMDNGRQLAAARSVGGSPESDRQFNVLGGLSPQALAAICMAGQTTSNVGSWSDHPQWSNPWGLTREPSLLHTDEAQSHRPQRASAEVEGEDDSNGSCADGGNPLLMYASPAGARAVRSCTIAQALYLGCWSNITAVCDEITEFWRSPKPIDLENVPDRNTNVLLLCPTSTLDPMRNMASLPPLSPEQILAGVLLFKLLQGPHDVDLGEVEEDDTIDIRDGRLTTRNILQHIVSTVSYDCASSASGGALPSGESRSAGSPGGDDANYGWLRLWTEAFEQGVTGGVAGVSAAAEVEAAWSLSDEDVALLGSMMCENGSSSGGNVDGGGEVAGEEGRDRDGRGALPVYDRDSRRFVAAALPDWRQQQRRQQSASKL